MSIYLPNGIAETLGDTLVTSEPLFLTDRLWYVDSETGVDDPAYGDTKAKPYASLAYALAGGAVSGDVIVLADGHNETVTSAIEVTISVIIVGVGQTDGKPTVKFTKDVAADQLIDIQAANVELRNIWFEENEQTSAVTSIQVTGTGCRLIGCYFEANGLHTTYSVTIANSLITHIKDCTFISTATTAALLPEGAVLMGLGLLILENNVFDSGTYGYSSFAFRASASATVRGDGNSFLREALFSAVEGAAHVLMFGGTMTGGVQLIEE